MKFINPECPFMFIDVKSKEGRHGSSFYNVDEAKVIAGFTNHWLPNSNFTKEQVWFISPYSA
jgi:hypothetical protein